LARRLLKQIGLDTIYAGQTKVDGAYFNVEDDVKDRKPFKAVLDAGLVRTTTGNRVFGVLKGACDGGINVPHSETRFPGQTRATEDGESSKYVPEDHKARIFGKHIDTYMKLLKETGAEAYKKQFSQWDATLKAAKVETVEKLITKVHAEIRKNPDRKAPKENKAPKRDHKKYYPNRLTVAQRKANV
jgi:large subunit ribosomal protein L5e